MKSVWMKNKTRYFEKLNCDIECEVLIVGGGLSGLLCVVQLQEHFKDIVLIESDEIGSGASGRNTGKVTSQHGFQYQTIMKFHGKEKARLYYEENEQAIVDLHEMIEKFQIECDWQSKKSIVGCKSQKFNQQVENEKKAYEECGLPVDEVIEGELYHGLRFSNQASFDPYAFMMQLVKHLEVRIYEHTPMMNINDHAVKTNQHIIRYEHCVLATQVMPFQFKFFYAFTTPKQSYLAAIHGLSQQDEMLLSRDEIVKTSNDMSEFSLLGGYDHKLSDDCNRIWREFNRDLVLEYPRQKVLCKWSSQDYEVFDGLPIVDKCDDFIVMTGFNKWGNTNAVVASKIVRDILLNQESDRRKLMSLRRKSLILNGKILSENLDVLKSLIQSKMKLSNMQVPKEQHAISFEIEKHPYGLYRDEDDLYMVDLICPHLGCTLKFNEFDVTWDCPCHGSRFSIEGKIIKGPANSSLHFSKGKVHEWK